jgi:DNA-binding NarL/FixJ family response regulator
VWFTEVYTVSRLCYYVSCKRESCGNAWGDGVAVGKAAELGTRETSGGLTAVVFDRYPLVLEVLTRFLRTLEIDVKGATTVPQQALKLIEAHSPDVFVASLDEAGVDVDTVALVREATQMTNEPKVIVLGSGDGRINELFAAGASAYVTNGATPDDIAVAIRQTYEHSIHLATDRRRGDVPTAADDAGLTEREVEVLALMAEGYSNTELARLLWVTPQTVKFHLSNIYRKLNVSNRTQASLWAQQAHLEAPESLVANGR